VIHDRAIIAANVHPVIRRLTEVRLAWQMSTVAVARRIGCHHRTFLAMESGEKEPSFKTLKKWADVLGYEINLWPKK
jgi:DNA-binding XRE family transcriptional regulator